MKVTISAALIVRNEADCLPSCLESVRDVVDEIVLVDTGSEDETVAIARRYTDRVFSFTWCDDFAAARNYSLEHVTGDYVLIIDADNQVENAKEARGLLEDFARRHDDAVVGTVEITSPIGTGPDAATAVEAAQRFYRRGRFRYAGAIHEQLVPTDGREHRLAPTGVRYSHSGYAHPADSPRHKSRRNIPMLEAQLAQCPDDDFYLFELGKAHFAVEDFQAAARAFERALDAVRFLPGQPPVGRAGPLPANVLADMLASLAYAYANTGRSQQARALLEDHRERAHAGTQIPDFHHALGYICLMLGDVPCAKKAYNAALHAGTAHEQVRGTGSFSSLYHLGLLCEAEGNLPGALEHYMRALEVKPDYHQALSRCIDLIVEYKAALPTALWALVDNAAFTALYTARLRNAVRSGAAEHARLLIEAAHALSADLAGACEQILVGEG